MKTEKLTLAMLNTLSKGAIGHLTMVKPETLLIWPRRFIKNFWTYKHNPPGRKPISKDIKTLILEMKQENPCREFVKQRIELFSDEFEDQNKTLIFDNTSQFTSLDYSWFNIKGVNICTAAPSMNANDERLAGTV